MSGGIQTAIPCALMRGGSSKGVYFLASDLPADPDERKAVVLAIMGGADLRQIDGLGGADPLTSKAAVVGPSARDDADVDYLFLQIVVGEGWVDDTPNCGNILAGVAPFAIETGLVNATDGETVVRIHMVNSGNLAELVVQTSGGLVNYDGDVQIDGVPGTSAPIACNFIDTAGSACGALLPTGNLQDEIEGIPVTCIDNGMPVVVMRARDLGRTGYESRDELNADNELKIRLEAIRQKAGPMMNLGDITEKVVPKMCLIAPPRNGGAVTTRTFIPHTCHAAVGVLGAVSVATACVLPGSVADGTAVVAEGREKTLSVEHPSGEFTVTLVVNESGTLPVVEKAGLLRTARMIFRGNACLPSRIWGGRRNENPGQVVRS
ncbi:MAG: 4-oxalomesaconate tautomerase [Proteobacteria bacterium]|nr:4-oxalomesaconate tautomerase [Pseudomonadota bacterium]